MEIRGQGIYYWFDSSHKLEREHLYLTACDHEKPEGCEVTCASEKENK